MVFVTSMRHAQLSIFRERQSEHIEDICHTHQQRGGQCGYWISQSMQLYDPYTTLGFSRRVLLKPFTGLEIQSISLNRVRGIAADRSRAIQRHRNL